MTVDRLRALDRDIFLVIAQLEPDDEGILRLVPAGPPIDPDQGASRRGATVQFGLTTDEIDGVWERIQRLIEDVDAGGLPVF